ncbi:reverse transcriptase domain-containing protein [Tanacetum coccineum]
MKKFVETLPTLIAPIHGEVLMMYLAASTESISIALFARREEGHVPIYFVSRVLQGAKLNYPTLEKLILALALTKPKKSRRVAKWEIELGEHDIVFRARGDNNKETPKDFLIEAPPEDNKKEVGRKTDTKLEEMKPSCESYTIEHIRRNQNKKADALSKLASMTFEHLTKEVLVEVLARRSIEEKEVLQVKTKEEERWMNPIHEYLLSGLVPEDSKESKKIKIKAPYFNMEPRLMVVRITKQGYYWPSMHKDVARIIKDCERCKEQFAIHRTLPRNNQKETPFILTYDSEVIIPTVESNVAKDDRGRTKEVTKRKESKEVASIEEAYYQNELRRYHSKRSNHSTYKVGDFILLLQNNKENPQVWQVPHTIREVYEGELYKIIDTSDHSLIQTPKGTNLLGLHKEKLLQERPRFGDWNRGWSSSLKRKARGLESLKGQVSKEMEAS